MLLIAAKPTTNTTNEIIYIKVKGGTNFWHGNKVRKEQKSLNTFESGLNTLSQTYLNNKKEFL